MYLLELCMFVLAFISVWIVVANRTIKKEYVYVIHGFFVVLLVLFAIFGTARWQFYPLYIAILILSPMMSRMHLKGIEIKKRIKIIMISISSILIVVSLLAFIVFPVYEIPTPSGEFLIGTESFIIEDNSRIEDYGDAREFRRIKIQIWYPAESIAGYKQAPWLEDGVEIARALSRDTGLPYFVLDHAANVMSNSYIDAPISNSSSTYPVVIISHGWRGFRNLHTDFAEELASRGYIVVAIDHTYGSVATVFDENDIAYLNLDALPLRETTDDFLLYANQLVYTYSEDISTTLDYLELVNEASSLSRFSERLDLSTIGLIGHSTGGGASVALALKDNRIDSVIGLDAWVEPIEQSELNKGLDIPSLFIRSGAWEVGFNNENLYSLINESSYPSELYQIDGTTHYDFAMVYMYSPLTKYIGFTGDVDSEDLTIILKDMITNFFDETLRDSENSDINPNDYEEVKTIPTVE